MNPNITTILSPQTATIKGVIALLLTLFLSGWVGFAAEEDQKESLKATIYFPTGYSTLNLNYRNNAAALEVFYEAVRNLQKDTTATLKSIRITGSSSPTGRTDCNETLSQKRGETLKNHLSRELSLPLSMFSVEWKGEDYEALLNILEESDFQWKEEVSDIVRNTPVWVVKDGKIVDSRKKRLMDLAGGRAWNTLKEEIFPLLQQSSAIECEIERKELPPVKETTTETETIVEEKQDTIIVAALLPAEPVEPIDTLMQVEKKPFYMAFKTNLLYDIALTPNIGAEVYLGKGWSISGNWQYAWWHNDNTHYYHRTYGGEIDLRKYFGEKAAQKPLTGHHFGVYMQGVTYDFEFGGTGNLSKFSYGAGVEYGYSLPVAKRLNLDFGVGLGYFGGQYKKYDPEDGHYVWKQTLQRNFFGPTKAEISLIWLLGRGNTNNLKKGGVK